MSEHLSSARNTFSPAALAALLAQKNVAAEQLIQPETTQPEIEPPYEGKIIELNGQAYRYAKMPTGQKVWNSDQQEYVPGYHSLRTWFSHHTTDIGPGPGWDMRLSLSKMTPDEMTERYGHVFTRKEVANPMGDQDFASGERTGGMPDDIPYYNLVPVDNEPPTETPA